MLIVLCGNLQFDDDVHTCNSAQDMYLHLLLIDPYNVVQERAALFAT